MNQMNIILALNTATEKNSVALYQAGKLEKEILWEYYRTQSSELLPEIDKLLKKNKVKLTDLRTIAVYQGPGSYTDLRVGITVANALAWSLDIPVIGIKYKISNIKNKKHLSKIDKYSALEIAKAAEKILLKKRLKRFSQIVNPYYGVLLK